MNPEVIFALGILLRWGISLYPYSGAGKAPLYGDYEAQRHWQEITVNLPTSEWYRNTTDNDLLYWGLDYPPLTAYHSYLCGLVAQRINPSYVELNKSRGYESDEHKLFMRYSVLIVDFLIYFPACFLLSRKLFHKATSLVGHYSSLAALILYPGLYLIDYGHFQYNNASLGLCLYALTAFLDGKDVIGAILFTLSLNYKQMELYHALPIFCYLLGRCGMKTTLFSKFAKFCQIGVAVILTFALCWFPFLGSLESVLHVISRIFPLNRGLFEDKVANIWCTLSIIIKFKSVVSTSVMALICLGATAVFSLPSNLIVLRYPTFRSLKYSLVNCSLVFFLFSFHVHEKSILLAVIPACVIFDEEPLVVTWYFVVSVLSMVPLLQRDGLALPAMSLSMTLMVISYYITDYGRFTFRYSFLKKVKPRLFVDTFVCFLFALCSLSLFASPPSRYPDIYPVIISAFSCCFYCFVCIYFHYCLYMGTPSSTKGDKIYSNVNARKKIR